MGSVPNSPHSSRTVGCVCGGESYIDKPLVSTVILPQIGELPVHLSIGVIEYRCYRVIGKSAA